MMTTGHGAWVQPSRRAVEATPAFSVPYGSARPNVVTVRGDNPRLAGLGCEGNRTCAPCAEAQAQEARYGPQSLYGFGAFGALLSSTAALQEMQNVVNIGSEALQELLNAKNTQDCDDLTYAAQTAKQQRATLSSLQFSSGDLQVGAARDDIMAALDTASFAAYGLASSYFNPGAGMFDCRSSSVDWSAVNGNIAALNNVIAQAQARIDAGALSTTSQTTAVDVVAPLNDYNTMIAQQNAQALAQRQSDCSSAAFLTDPTTGITCENYSQMCGQPMPTVVNAACLAEKGLGNLGAYAKYAAYAAIALLLFRGKRAVFG